MIQIVNDIKLKIKLANILQPWIANTMHKNISDRNLSVICNYELHID